jgi:hypothetical protein
MRLIIPNPIGVRAEPEIPRFLSDNNRLSTRQRAAGGLLLLEYSRLAQG